MENNKTCDNCMWEKCETNSAPCSTCEVAQWSPLQFTNWARTPEEAWKEKTPEVSPEPLKPLQTQVGGTHYKGLKIQPIEYIHANKMNYCEANVIKYISRWRDKGGIKDLEKVKHYVDLLIELEGLNEEKTK